VGWTTVPQKGNETRGLSHCGSAIYIKKDLKAKERRFMETQIFHHANLQNSPLKETKILQVIITL
jgi:hypothetical protein